MKRFIALVCATVTSIGVAAFTTPRIDAQEESFCDVKDQTQGLLKDFTFTKVPPSFTDVTCKQNIFWGCTSGSTSGCSPCFKATLERYDGDRNEYDPVGPSWTWNPVPSLPCGSAVQAVNVTHSFSALADGLYRLTISVGMPGTQYPYEGDCLNKMSYIHTFGVEQWP